MIKTQLSPLSIESFLDTELFPTIILSSPPYGNTNPPNASKQSTKIHELHVQYKNAAFLQESFLFDKWLQHPHLKDVIQHAYDEERSASNILQSIESGDRIQVFVFPFLESVVCKFQQPSTSASATSTTSASSSTNTTLETTKNEQKITNNINSPKMTMRTSDDSLPHSISTLAQPISLRLSDLLGSGSESSLKNEQTSSAITRPSFPLPTKPLGFESSSSSPDIRKPPSPTAEGIYLSKTSTPNAIHITKKRKGEMKQVTIKPRGSDDNLSFAIIAEVVPQKMWTCNSDGLLDWCNQEFSHGTGLTIEELQGFGWGAILHPDDYEKTIQVWSNAFRLGMKYEIEYRFRTADGTYRWHLGRANPLRDEDGRTVKWIGTSTDIHPQKMAEEERHAALLALRESEARLRTLYEAEIVGIFSHDSNGKILDSNDAFLKMLHYTREEFSKTQLNLSDLIVGDSNQELIASEHLRLTQRSPPLEREFLRKDKTRLSVMIGTAMYESHGQTQYISIVLDISSRRIAEEQALAAAKSKAFFIANISHEIRTPLNGVCGMTELLQDTPLDNVQRDYVQIIKKSSEVLLMLINNVLDFSKMEVGKMSLESSEFEVQAVIEDIIDLLGEAANAKGIDLIYLVNNARSFTSVIGDHGRLRQILINLVNNAIKFTDHGAVRVQVEAEDIPGLAPDEISLKFRISDTGVGISEDFIPQLFQPFTQVDNSASRSITGTGLGLTICRQLVQLFNGEIGVESKINEGSTFWFTIRLKVASDKSETWDLMSYQFSFLEHAKVLVMDPSSAIREAIHSFFSSWNIQCHPVVDSTQALKALKAAVDAGQPYAVAFVGSSGILQLARIIETSPTPLNQTKLISIGTDLHVRSRCIMGCLSKPIRQSKLFDALMRVLSISPSKDPSMNGGPALRKHSLPEFSELDPKQCNNTIMLVEDNAVNQKVAIKQLEKLGCRKVVAVANGIEALRLLDQSKDAYSLILMDCQMPIMDGFTATREIRRREQRSGSTRPPIPIVAMTANALNHAAEECIKAGMSDYVCKPVKIETLYNVLTKWLPISSTEHQS